MTIDPLHPAGLRPGSMMLHALARNWWLLLLRGIAGIVFGVLAFMLPGLTLLTLILLYGIYAVASGVLAIGAAIMGGTAGAGVGAGMGARWWLALIGVAGIVAGILAFAWPGVTAIVLVLFIAAWAVVTGVFEIVGAIQLRKVIDNEWVLILSGALSVLFGVVLAAMPGTGALALVWVIGAYAIVAGVLWIALALRLRSHSYAHA